jgi:hypothetical protein
MPTQATKTGELVAAGEIIETITSRKTGAVIATIRRLPGGLLAADVQESCGLKYCLVAIDPSRSGGAR